MSWKVVLRGVNRLKAPSLLLNHRLHRTQIQRFNGISKSLSQNNHWNVFLVFWGGKEICFHIQSIIAIVLFVDVSIGRLYLAFDLSRTVTGSTCFGSRVNLIMSKKAISLFGMKNPL